jgi:E3 ubiquitin-protein ligase EDD1
VLGNTLEYWGGVDESESPFPPGVNKFVKITSMHSELIALADDGKLYGWSWEKKAKPASAPHRAGVKLLGAKEMSDADATSGEIEERIIDMESCAWRTVVMTNLMRVGSFVDGICGTKIFDAFFDALLDVPNGESVEKLHVCPLFSAVQTTNNYVFWRGVYPFNERRKLYEKSKSKMKKHVTFDTSEVTVGCEVRTKSSPIYAAGSVAINFSGGVPLVVS